MKWAWRIVLLLSFVACSDSPYPDCEPGQVVIAGELDGAEVRYEFQIGNYQWINIGDSHVDVFESGGSDELHIFWSDSISNGESTSSQGWFNYAEVKIGNCDTDAPASSITARDHGADFMFTDLRANADCSGANIPGKLYGCLRKGND